MFKTSYASFIRELKIPSIPALLASFLNIKLTNIKKIINTCLSYTHKSLFQESPISKALLQEIPISKDCLRNRVVNKKMSSKFKL